MKIVIQDGDECHEFSSVPAPPGMKQQKGAWIETVEIDLRSSSCRVRLLTDSSVVDIPTTRRSQRWLRGRDWSNPDHSDSHMSVLLDFVGQYIISNLTVRPDESSGGAGNPMHDMQEMDEEIARMQVQMAAGDQGPVHAEMAH